MKLLYILGFLIIIFSLTNCKQHFEVPVNSINNYYLVVEGNINSGNGPTSITLSRTFKLSDTASVTYESNAQVAVLGNDNSIHPLTETSAGVYTSPALGLNYFTKYRLSILTSQGKQYYSDYVKPINNPPIDSVNWNLNSSGVSVYVNTHDPNDSVQYYQWQYQETWEIRSAYFANVKAVFPQDTVIPRLPSEYVYTCYKYRNSTKFLLANTSKLSQSTISNYPLVHFPFGSEELQYKYSILVSQYSLSKSAYEYYNLLKKNTESLGSLFDAQPSDINGNIHSVSNPSEPVIGFLTICPTRQQRIFILNDYFLQWDFIMDCGLKKYIVNNKDSLRIYLGSYDVYGVDQLGSKILGYYSALPQCVDCTVRGGSTTKPSYW